MKLDQNNYKNISNSLFYSSMFYLFIFCFFFSINCCYCCCNTSNNSNEEFKSTKIGSEHFDDLILGDIQKDRKNYFLFIFNIFYFNLNNI